MATDWPKVGNVLNPVVIFVYNRPAHTLRLLKSLLGCHEFFSSKVYVFSDGPKHEADRKKVENVRRIISELMSGIDCQLTYRENNLGLAMSVISGITEVLKDHMSVIVLEDDLVVSSDFLKYMNWGLQVFRDNPQIFSLTGFSFPEKYFSLPANYSHSVFLSPRCGSWSWGTWRDRWAEVDWEMSDFQEFCEDDDRQAEFNRIGWDLSRMLKFQSSGAIDSWAIRFCYAHFKASAYCVHPISTLVHNFGFDSSGTHSWSDRRFLHTDQFTPWRYRKSDQFAVPNDEVNLEVSRIYAGKTGPMSSRLRGTITRSAIGRLLQRIVLYWK